MALYAVSAGGTILAADVNQYENLLNGTMTDQPVTLSNDLTAQHGIRLGSIAPVGAGPNLHSDGTNIYLETSGAGTISLRPNGPGSTTNQATYNSAGQLTVAGAVVVGTTLSVTGTATMAAINTLTSPINCGGLTATTGTFSGAVSATSGTFSGLVTASAALTTSGTVTHNSVGTMVLAGANTFTGSWASAGISLHLNVSGTDYLVQLGH